MSTQYHVPLYEGDSLFHQAPRQLRSTRASQAFERAIDVVLGYVRRIDRAWVEGMERARARRTEALLEGSGDVYELERRLVAIERGRLV